MTEIADNEMASALESGIVPVAPAQLEPDDVVIVGVWRRGDVGAVMTIWRDPEGDIDAVPDDDTWPYNVDIETYERVGNSWEWRGTGDRTGRSRTDRGRGSRFPR